MGHVRRVTIRVLAFSIGALFLLYGFLMTSGGLFSRTDMIVFGTIALAIGYRFFSNGLQEFCNTNFLWSLSVEGALLGFCALSLAFWSWAKSDLTSVIVWTTLSTIAAILSCVALFERRHQLHN
jgi:hypothetical protein